MMLGMKTVYPIRLLKFFSMIYGQRKTFRKKNPHNPFLQFFWKACDGKTWNLRGGGGRGREKKNYRKLFALERKKDEIMSKKMLLLIYFNAAFTASCQPFQPHSTMNSVSSEMIRYFQCIYSVTKLYNIMQL